MKKVLFFAVLIFIVNDLFSQACGNSSLSHIPNIAPHSESGVWVNVYYHIVKKTDGSGSTIVSSDICQTTSGLNAIFNKYGIFFKQIGTDDINNDALYDFNGTASESNTLFSTQSRQDAVNIYILPSIAHPCVKNIPSYAMAVGESDIKNRIPTIAHEMGHCFGLYHTHETAFGIEQINGSNSTTAGDKISDTAADPDLSFSVTNCQYTGSTLQNGQPFTPDPRNVMSYSTSSCLDRFSPLQVNVMYNTIFGRNVGNTGPDYFEGIRAATNGIVIPSLNSPNPICLSGQRISLNSLPYTFYAFWSSSNTSVADVDANIFTHRNRTYLTKNSNGFTTITAYVTDGCQAYSVSKEIYVGTPPQIEGTYSYGSNTYPVNNPSTGIAVSSNNIYINLVQSIPNLTYSWNITASGNTSGGSTNSYLSANGTQASIYLARSNYMNIDCNAVNTCGNSPTISFNCYNYSYYRIVASPNPTSQNLSITTNLVEEPSVSNRSEPLLKTRDVNKTPVKLLDGSNRVVANGKLTNGTFECRLSNVPNGTYYLQISEGTDMITKQILVQH